MCATKMQVVSVYFAQCAIRCFECAWVIGGSASRGGVHVPERCSNHGVLRFIDDIGNCPGARQSVAQGSEPGGEMQAPVLNPCQLIRARAARRFELIEKSSRRVILALKRR